MNTQDISILKALIQAGSLSKTGCQAVVQLLDASNTDKTFDVEDNGETKSLVEDLPLDPYMVTSEPPGRYRRTADLATAVIGRGGLGEVVAVYDRHLRREVAQKALHSHIVSLKPSIPAGATPPTVTDRFLREARITASLEHPGVVPIYELGQRADGTLYYTMKRIRGRTLADAIKNVASLEGRLSLIGHFVDLCQAIAYAHSKGVIHRDLKPQNIMVGEFGETIVLDWGLARVQPEGVEPVHASMDSLIAKVGETQAGAIMGTPAYMSPEQAQGRIEDVDTRSDVWSLGAILYELITGSPPYLGNDSRDVLRYAIKGKVTPVREVQPDTPPELVAIVARAMAQEPEQRYPNARELAAEVEAWRGGHRVASYAYTTREVLKRFIAQHRAEVMVAGIAMLILTLGAASAYTNIRIERDRAVIAEQSTRATLFTALARQSELASDWGVAVALWRAAFEESVPKERPAVAVELSRLTASAPKHQVLVEQGASHGVWVDQNTIAVAYLSGRISLIDARSGAWITDLPDSADRSCLDNMWKMFTVPGGQTLIGLSAKALCRWDVSSRQVTNVFLHRDGWSGRISLSKDGRYLAESGKTVVVTDLERGVQTVSIQNDAVLQYSPDGYIAQVRPGSGDVVFAGDSSLFVTNVETSLLMLDARDGKIIARTELPFGGKLSVTDDASRVVAFDNRLWDWIPGESASQRFVSASQVNWAAFAPKSEALLVATDRFTTFYNTHTLLFPAIFDRLKQPLFAPDGLGVFLFISPGVWGVYDLTDGLSLARMDGVRSPIQSSSFGADSHSMITTLDDGSIHLWSWDAQPFLLKINIFRNTFFPRGSDRMGMAFGNVIHSGDPQIIDISSGQRTTISVTPENANRVCQVIPGKNGAYAMIYADECFPMFQDSHLTLERENGIQTQILDVPFKRFNVSPDGDWLMVATSNECVSIYPIWTDAPVRNICGETGAPDDFPRVSFLSTPETAVIEFKTASHVLDLQSGASLCEIPNVAGRLVDAAAEADAVLFGGPKALTVWESRSCKLLRTISTTERSWGSLGISADGSIVGGIRGSEFMAFHGTDMMTRVSLSVTDRNSSMLLSPNGHLAAIMEGNPGILRIISTDTGITQMKYRMPELNTAGLYTFRHDSQQILITPNDILGILPVPATSTEEVTQQTAGSLTNIRICKDTLLPVTVLPFPTAETVWAPPESCHTQK